MRDDLSSDELREDWAVVRSLLPANWGALAVETGALKGLRKNKSAEGLLRVLLIHLGCGYSLRETAVRAREAQLAELSSVAVWNRLKKSRGWLQALCKELFRERNVELRSGGQRRVRAVDGTTVREPGRTGSLWQVHYSVGLPSLDCDFFQLKRAQGVGTGETWAHFPVRQGDLLLADSAYSTARGLRHVTRAGGEVLVRGNMSSLVLRQSDGQPFDQLASLRTLTRTAEGGSWAVQAVSQRSASVPGRLCAIRKTRAAIRLAQQKLRRQASKTGSELRAETLEYAKYVIVFTTLPSEEYSARQVLDLYRARWQTELVLKRFRSIARLGHLPKHDHDGAQAWLYGKLLVALLIEKLVSQASYSSPWGCDLAPSTSPQRVA